MILRPTTVELTKIHYYNAKNPIPISTISREVFDNQVNSNVIVKKNIFGPRWILKINEIENGNKQKSAEKNLIVYVLIFCCISVAIAFGVYFTFETSHRLVQRKNATEILRKIEPIILTTPTNTFPATKHEKIVMFCQNCTIRNEICLKLSETDTPKCVRPLDRKDPTGCGGLCSIDLQFCQMLDNKYKIYQCSNFKNVLKCSMGSFNCGNMCINKNRRCDGTVHCSNQSDEMNCECNLETHFRCSNKTSCFPKEKKCDGIIDCWDKSDEIDCKIGCKNGTLPCLNGDCIARAHFCDGQFHCSDHSDEPEGCQI